MRSKTLWFIMLCVALAGCRATPPRIDTYAREDIRHRSVPVPVPRDTAEVTVRVSIDTATGKVTATAAVTEKTAGSEVVVVQESGGARIIFRTLRDTVVVFATDTLREVSVKETAAPPARREKAGAWIQWLLSSFVLISLIICISVILKRVKA